MNMLDLDMANGGASAAEAAESFSDGSVGAAPADEQDIAGLIAEQFRGGEGCGDGLNFLPALDRHFGVHRRAGRRMAILIVLQTGDGGIFA